MSRHSRALSFFLTLSLFFSLGACEITGEKREPGGDDSVLVSYFFSDQYAINDNDYRDFLSFYFGGVVAAAPTSSMELWTRPPTGCFSTSSFINVASNNVGVRRLLDVGTLSLKDPLGAVQALSKETDNNYFYVKALTPGTYKLLSPGIKSGALAFEQGFDVLEKGGGVKVYTWLSTDTSTPPVEQALASPAVPAPTDANYKVVFNRLTTNVLSFQAPEGTDYVRLRLRDGSNTSGGDVTCFAKTDEPLVVQQGALYSFRTGTQGHMELDFVTSSTIQDVSRLKRGTVISTMRHFQGTFEYTNSNGIKVTDNIGLVEFR
jgi:hypothetical protein